MPIISCDDFCQKITDVFYGRRARVNEEIGQDGEERYKIYGYAVPISCESHIVFYCAFSSKSFSERRAQVVFATEGSRAAGIGLTPQHILTEMKKEKESKSPVTSPPLPPIAPSAISTEKSYVVESKAAVMIRTEYEDAIRAMAMSAPEGPFFSPPTYCSVMNWCCLPCNAVGLCGTFCCLKPFEVMMGCINDCFVDKKSCAAICCKVCGGGICCCLGVVAMSCSIGASELRKTCSAEDIKPSKRGTIKNYKKIIVSSPKSQSVSPHLDVACSDITVRKQVRSKARAIYSADDMELDEKRSKLKITTTAIVAKATGISLEVVRAQRHLEKRFLQPPAMASNVVVENKEDTKNFRSILEARAKIHSAGRRAVGSDLTGIVSAEYFAAIKNLTVAVPSDSPVTKPKGLAMSRAES